MGVSCIPSLCIPSAKRTGVVKVIDVDLLDLLHSRQLLVLAAPALERRHGVDPVRLHLQSPYTCWSSDHRLPFSACKENARRRRMQSRLLSIAAKTLNSEAAARRRR